MKTWCSVGVGYFMVDGDRRLCLECHRVHQQSVEVNKFIAKLEGMVK